MLLQASSILRTPLGVLLAWLRVCFYFRPSALQGAFLFYPLAMVLGSTTIPKPMRVLARRMVRAGRVGIPPRGREHECKKRSHSVVRVLDLLRS